jgi:hypothetical protein
MPSDAHSHPEFPAFAFSGLPQGFLTHHLLIIKKAIFMPEKS